MIRATSGAPGSARARRRRYATASPTATRTRPAGAAFAGHGRPERDSGPPARGATLRGVRAVATATGGCAGRARTRVRSEMACLRTDARGRTFAAAARRPAALVGAADERRRPAVAASTGRDRPRVATSGFGENASPRARPGTCSREGGGDAAPLAGAAAFVGVDAGIDAGGTTEDAEPATAGGAAGDGWTTTGGAGAGAGGAAGGTGKTAGGRAGSNPSGST
jgi:hypothetical protein